MSVYRIELTDTEIRLLVDQIQNHISLTEVEFREIDSELNEQVRIEGDHDYQLHAERDGLLQAIEDSKQLLEKLKTTLGGGP